MFTLKYTSTLQELQRYLDERFEQYLKIKELGEEQTLLVKTHYEEEKRIMVEQVCDSHDKLRGMCFMAFLGHLSKEKNLKVSNIVIQCPFLLYLLGVASFDVFEEGCGGIDYLIKRSKINTTEYFVDGQFYKSAKREIGVFFEQSGYECVLLVDTKSKAVYSTDGESIRMLVVPCEDEVLEQKSEQGMLDERNACISEDRWSELYSQELVYNFLPMTQAREGWTEEVTLAVQAYQKREMDKTTAIRIVASDMITYVCDGNFEYNSAMQKLGVQIYSREDLYKYLLAHQIQEEKAWYWTEMIRKGTLTRKLQKRQISYPDYVQLYLAIGEDIIDLFCHVRYISPCWEVLESFYRLTELCTDRKQD